MLCLAERRRETLLKVQTDELPAEGSRGHITKLDHMTDKDAPRGDLTQQEVTESVAAYGEARLPVQMKF